MPRQDRNISMRMRLLERRTKVMREAKHEAQQMAAHWNDPASAMIHGLARIALSLERIALNQEINQASTPNMYDEEGQV